MGLINPLRLRLWLWEALVDKHLHPPILFTLCLGKENAPRLQNPHVTAQRLWPLSPQTDVMHQSVFELIHTEDQQEFRRNLHWALDPPDTPPITNVLRTSSEQPPTAGLSQPIAAQSSRGGDFLAGGAIMSWSVL